MEKCKTRALRRHHVARVKAACAKHWTVHRWNEVVDKTSREYLCRLGKAVATPAACSCWGCGNPRRRMGEKTRQEISEAQVANVLLKDAPLETELKAELKAELKNAFMD